MKSLPIPPSKDIIGLLVVANQLREKQDFKQALIIYDQVSSQVGESGDMLRILASCHFQIGMYEGDENSHQIAISLLKKALQLDPKNDLLHTDLGQIYSLGFLDYSMAAQEFRVAITLNPENKQALLGGVALYGVPDDVVTSEEAIGWLTKVIYLEPNDPNHRFRLGKLYYDLRKWQEAQNEWSIALICPTHLNELAVQSIKQLLKTIQG